MNEQTELVGLIILFPLLGFIINGIFGAIPWKGMPRIPKTVSGIIASAFVVMSFIVSAKLFFQIHAEYKAFEYLAFNWIEIGEFSIPMAFRFDNLSGLLCMIVTGVGSLIHIYSIGYMHDDENPQRFFTYLNLFTASMLVLILGANLPILFIGWEGVGLCSYLLIGFWFSDEEKAKAGKKAFIVNRIGDLGFLLGVFLIFASFRTLDFMELKEVISGAAPELKFGLLTAITMLLFVGAMGKSAQIPLFVWLPDAMAGPTPVSALIHAATMVTAGVYLTCRLSFMYTLAPITSELITIVACLTAFVAATIAIVQTDIKKVLAYSTVSQLGYMFVAVGVGAYWVAVFHLMTHAFFKALMFLGSGSVIHAMGGEQDIRKMGGLHKYMPITSITFAIGTMAISGVPLFSGFFSKDEILWQAFASDHGSIIFYLISLATAGLTATYMGRLYCLTFLGENRSDHHTREHLHESPNVMTMPLVVLAFLSAFGGFLGFPHFIGGDTIPNWIQHLLVPSVVVESHAHGSLALEWGLLLVSVVVGLSGLYGAYWYFVVQRMAGNKNKQVEINTSEGVNSFLLNSYRLNEFYDLVIVRPLMKASDFLWRVIDVILIDGLVISMARIARVSGQFARGIQTGVLEHYVAAMVIGMITLAIVLLVGGI
jgi:NADH-quinone oxidoreductase subunit L